MPPRPTESRRSSLTAQAALAGTRLPPSRAPRTGGHPRRPRDARARRREAARGVLERLDRAVLVAWRRRAGPRRAGRSPGGGATSPATRPPSSAASRVPSPTVTSWSAKVPGTSLVAVVPDQVREVLDEVAAERDVQHLRAAADREHRQVALERRVAAARARPHRARARRRSSPGAAPGRRARGRGRSRRRRSARRARRASPRPLERGRHEQRPPAGALDRAHVVGRNERRSSSSQTPNAAAMT